MADQQFRLLHDPEFLLRTRHLPAEVLAEELGCRRTTVEAYRRKHGLLRRPPWGPVEIDLLFQFYGRYPAAYIAAGLRRSERSVYSCAARHGLRASVGRRRSAQTEFAFWRAWQVALRENWPAWCRRGLTESALEIVWRPGQPDVDCSRCPHLAVCRTMEDLPLRCERLTLGDVLELHLSEAQRALYHPERPG